MNDEMNGLILKVLKNKENKNKFILYFLIKNWSDICGKTGAKHSQPKKLENNILFINTDNAAWSHNFLMMKVQLINKINSIIPIEKDKKRSTRIKEIIFYNGRINDYFSEKTIINEENERNKEKIELNEREINKINEIVCNNTKDEKLRDIFSKLIKKDRINKKKLLLDGENFCKKCGIPIKVGDKYCVVCEIKEKQEKKIKIAELLRNAPWISHDECIKYIKCDRILYDEVRENMLKKTIGIAVLQNSTLEEQIFAVMLDKRILPENIQIDMVKQTVANYRKRKEYHVFTPR